MKTASNIAERIEEYRYYSGSIGNVRPLTINALSLRIGAFIKVHKRAVESAKGGPTNRKSRRR